MKKISILSIALLAINFCFAQDAKTTQTKFGLKAGLNLADFNGDLEGDGNLVGVNFGGFVEIKTSDKFAIQPELTYSTQGAKDSEGSLNLSYINVPVIFKYYASEKINIDFGPQLSFLTSARAKAESQNLDYDAKDLFKSTDFGFNLGLGYNFNEKVNLGFRYYGGLTNVLSEDFQNAIEQQTGLSSVKAKNSVISLNLNYKF